MEALLDAVTELVALLPPSKIEAIASRLYQRRRVMTRKGFPNRVTM